MIGNEGRGERLSGGVRLKNIGPRSAAWLADIGIGTLDDLERVGPIEAWRPAKRAYPDRVSVTLLYALQGALLDLPWNELPEEIKRQLADAARSRWQEGAEPSGARSDG